MSGTQRVAVIGACEVERFRGVDAREDGAAVIELRTTTAAPSEF